MKKLNFFKMQEKFKNYQKAMDDMRSFYKREADVDLDDEVLRIFIRINWLQNEMNKSLDTFRKEMSKTVNSIEKVQFRGQWDYFAYGIGKSLLPSLLILTIAVVGFFMYKATIETKADNSIEIVEGKPYLKISQTNHNYYLPLKSN